MITKKHRFMWVHENESMSSQSSNCKMLLPLTCKPPTELEYGWLNNWFYRQAPISQLIEQSLLGIIDFITALYNIFQIATGKRMIVVKTKLGWPFASDLYILSDITPPNHAHHQKQCSFNINHLSIYLSSTFHMRTFAMRGQN